MHPYIRNPYRPPEFAPSERPTAPIQLPVELSASQLANELHAQLTRIATGRDLRVLRRQARNGFRAVLRHARARRLEGFPNAPLAIHRVEPQRVAVHRHTPRRRHPIR